MTTPVTEADLREDLRAFFQAAAGAPPEPALRAQIVAAAAAAAAEQAAARAAGVPLRVRKFGFGFLLGAIGFTAVSIAGIALALNLWGGSDEPQEPGAPVAATTLPPSPSSTVPAPAVVLPADDGSSSTVTSEAAGTATTQAVADDETTATSEGPGTTEAGVTTVPTTPGAGPIPTTTTTTQPAPIVPYTVNQDFGSSSSPQPFDRFHGTAPPGTQVRVSSAYGSAETVADEAGNWTVEVRFVGAPFNESFQVRVNLEPHTFLLRFTWVFAPTTVNQTLGTSDLADPFDQFFGTAPPGTTVTVSSSYGSGQAVADDDGNWSVLVPFSNPPLGVSFPVTVQVGDRTFMLSFRWDYDPGSAVTVAYQTYGTSDIPRERFYGTAPPGTDVAVSSPYGAAQTTADSVGDWSVEVRFVGAPEGEPFSVTVRVGDRSYTFSFTWQPGS